MKHTKFVCTGPESSGKTTLCTALAKHFHMDMVDEYARTYLNLMGSAYLQKDLYVIAERQLENEKKFEGKPFLLCDTDLLTTYIWMQDKFGITDLNFTRQLDACKGRVYLLCKPDIPWEMDELRENKDDRDRIFELYVNALNFFNLTYFIVEGNDFGKRVQFAKSILNKYKIDSFEVFK